MPHAADHEQQAQRNRAFFESIGGENADYPEWAITALFYVAVQGVQALCVRKGWRVLNRNGVAVIPRNHEQRLDAVDAYLSPIADEYRALKDWSEGARYECQAFQPAHIALARAQLDTILTHLASVP